MPKIKEFDEILKEIEKTKDIFVQQQQNILTHNIIKGDYDCLQNIGIVIDTILANDEIINSALIQIKNAMEDLSRTAFMLRDGFQERERRRMLGIED